MLKEMFHLKTGKNDYHEKDIHHLHYFIFFFLPHKKLNSNERFFATFALLSNAVEFDLKKKYNFFYFLNFYSFHLFFQL